MKIAITLALVIVGLCLGGAAYYQQSTAEQDRLNGELADARRDNTSLVTELSNAKANVDALSAELTKARAKADNAATDMAKWKEEARIKNAEASEASRRADALSTDLNLVKERLIEATQNVKRAAAQNDVMAGLLSRQAAIDKLMNADLAAAVARVQREQTNFLVAPSPGTFAAFKSSLGDAVDICRKSSDAIDDLDEYTDKNQQSLAAGGAAAGGGAESVGTIRLRINDARAKLPPFQRTLEETLNTCRESSQAVTSTDGWQGGDITLGAGEVVAVQATGDWMYSPKTKRRVGAAGEDWELGPRLIQAMNNGALLLRIRGTDVVHPGVGYSIAEKSGRVEFRINDTDIVDNQGTLQVKVWAFRPMRD